MNKLYIILLASLVINITASKAQDINWKKVEDGKRHFTGLNFGVYNSSYYGLTYGYSIKNKLLPIVAGIEFNIPFGKDVFDDCYSKTGFQSQLFDKYNLSWSVQGSFIARRSESVVARLVNFGADFGTLIGYQKHKWGINAEIGFDKSIATNIKNKILKDFYPSIKDGWYDTNGGTYRFGIQGNITIKTYNLFLHVGKTYGQNFDNNPSLPFYTKVSLQKAF